MLMQLFLWSLTIASLTGVYLNVRRRWEGFAIWTVTNLSWAIIDASHGIWSQAALQSVYCGFAVYGIWSWKIRKTDAKP